MLPSLPPLLLRVSESGTEVSRVTQRKNKQTTKQTRLLPFAVLLSTESSAIVESGVRVWEKLRLETSPKHKPKKKKKCNTTIQNSKKGK
jgi:hypothetical protein